MTGSIVVCSLRTQNLAVKDGMLYKKRDAVDPLKRVWSE